MKKNEMLALMGDAKPSADLSLKKLSRMGFVRFNTKTKTGTLSAAAVATMEDAAGEVFHAIVSYSPQGWEVQCGDVFLEKEGKKAWLIEDAELERYFKTALEVVPSFKREPMDKSLRAGQHSLAAAGECAFWMNWRKARTLCSHTQHVLAEVGDEAFLDSLKDDYEAMVSMKVEIEPKAQSTMSRYAFSTPVLIEGEQGSGKTTWARKFAQDNGYAYVELAGHESVESLDMLGHYVRTASGEFVWKDGKLSQAFRLAGRGTKVVLLLDEMLRIPQRQLSALLTAFSPFDGRYRLSTGRMVDAVDGVGLEEELSCEVGNLAIFATTNVGSQFAVDDLDPAMAERFVPVRMDTSPAELFAILAVICAEQGLGDDEAARLVDFLSKMTDARRNGLVAGVPTTRTLVRALTGSKDTAEIHQRVLDQMLLWVNRDLEGRPNTEQLQTIETLAGQVFRASTGARGKR